MTKEFKSNISAPKIIKSGGTSGQYLMADGSVTTGTGGSSGITYTYSSSAPISPTAGDIWIDSDTGIEYTFINDGTDPVWANMSSGNLVGSIGPSGPTGITGNTGNAATITVGTTTTGNAGTTASVINSGTISAATLDFTIPRGDTGTAATVGVGTTTTGTPGSSASVSNSGTSSAATFNFTIPRGDTGTAATVGVGTTTTGTPGSSASVTNSGTTSAAVFNFTVPQGIQGPASSAYVPMFSKQGPLSVATGTHRYYVESAATITKVRIATGTAPTGASLIVDVNKNGTTIYTTQANRPAITAGTNTATGNTIDVTGLVAGDYITVDIDQVGSTIAGSDLTVILTLVQ